MCIRDSLKGVRSAGGICPPALSGCTSYEQCLPAEFVRRKIVLCPRCQGPSLLKGLEVRQQARLLSPPSRPSLLEGVRSARGPFSVSLSARDSCVLPSPPCSLVVSIRSRRPCPHRLTSRLHHEIPSVTAEGRGARNTRAAQWSKRLINTRVVL